MNMWLRNGTGLRRLETLGGDGMSQDKRLNCHHHGQQRLQHSGRAHASGANTWQVMGLIPVGCWAFLLLLSFFSHSKLVECPKSGPSNRFISTNYKVNKNSISSCAAQGKTNLTYAQNGILISFYSRSGIWWENLWTPGARFESLHWQWPTDAQMRGSSLIDVH